MKNFFTFEKFVDQLPKKTHLLSGVVLLLNNQILLVNPKKYKEMPNRWSIPKGHVEEDMTELETAITELSEEANIQLAPSKFKNAVKDKIIYFKGDKTKVLTYYVISITKNDIDFKLYNDMILKYYLNKDEIAEAGFFSKADALELIESQQKDVLKHVK